MIKVTLGEKPKEEKPFPKLMIHQEGDLIVYFWAKEKGVPVYAKPETDSFDDHFGRRYDPLGALNDWEMSEFSDYNEPITLQNA